MRKRPILTLSFVSHCGRRAEGGVTFSGTQDRFSGGVSHSGAISADMPHIGPVSAEKSHRLRMSSHIGRQWRLSAGDADIRLISVDVADNRQMSANPSHSGPISVRSSHNGLISADPSDMGGLMADILPTGGCSRTFPAGRRPCAARLGGRTESLRIRPESCLARGRFHGFMCVTKGEAPWNATQTTPSNATGTC